MKYKAAIFDMDGTILSTIEDLSGGLNYALGACGLRNDYSIAETRRFFGSGIEVAIARAIMRSNGAEWEEIMKLGNDSAISGKSSDSASGDTNDDRKAGSDSASYDIKNDETVARVRDVFAEYYPSHCAIETKPFPGIPELLDNLNKAGVATAVVSNKIDPAVQELVKKYFSGKFLAARGEGAPLRRKPYPDMVEAILEQLGVSADEAVYIGDSEVDYETAVNSKMDCICVDWGFREREFLESIGADTIVGDAAELEKLIMG